MLSDNLKVLRGIRNKLSGGGTRGVQQCVNIAVDLSKSPIWQAVPKNFCGLQGDGTAWRKAALRRFPVGARSPPVEGRMRRDVSCVHRSGSHVRKRKTSLC
ncbi:hypothetical protein scyTo_0004952 [Scyliorhinus torazame]|uniref:Uncharacterized protein n=1 Tax=Scyliorhinus torazame TaxID=75743 RepID=A0A401NZS0_SCYTO|nr:hypothetical protein [Scyliorhinus torazame]